MRKALINKGRIAFYLFAVLVHNTNILPFNVDKLPSFQFAEHVRDCCTRRKEKARGVLDAPVYVVKLQRWLIALSFKQDPID